MLRWLLLGLTMACGMQSDVSTLSGIEDIETIRIKCVTGIYEEVTYEELKSKKVCEGKTFISFCQERFADSHDEEQKKQIRHTVDVLKKHVKSDDCNEAYIKLKKLSFLALHHKKIVDVSPLVGLNNLRHLDLSHNLISDLTPLASLKGLSILAVNNNKLGAMRVLDMPKLRRLYISNNPLPNLVSLRGMFNLRWLVLDNTEFQQDDYVGIESLDGLQFATRLGHVEVAGVALRDASSIADLSLIRNLNLRENALTSMPALASRYVHSIDMSDNQIESIDSIATNRSLRAINFANNRIKSLSPLQDLVNLLELRFDGNAIGDITPLAGLYDLERVSLRDNSIMDLMALAPLHQLAIAGEEFRGNPVHEGRSGDNCPMNAVSVGLRTYCGG